MVEQGRERRRREIEEIIRIISRTAGVLALDISRGNPFKVLISTILSQRTRDENTIKASRKLFSVYSTPEQIAGAGRKELEKLVRSTGFYKVKAGRIKEVSKIIHEKYKNKVPAKIDELLKLSGVGRKTANCVLVYGYGKPAIPVDTHVHRVFNRLGLVKTKTPEKTEEELRKIIPKKLWIEVNESFVRFGQKVCQPIRPRCGICTVTKHCSYYAAVVAPSKEID